MVSFTVLSIKKAMQSLHGFWWSTTGNIRTENLLDILQRNRLRFVFVVIGHHQLVFKHIDAVNKNIDDLLLIFQIVGIAIFEPFDPANDLFFGELWLAQLFLQDADVQFFICL